MKGTSQAFSFGQPNQVDASAARGKVLVVGEQAEISSQLGGSLREFGYDVVSASGFEQLSAATPGSCELVLLLVSGLDPHTLCEQVANLTRISPRLSVVPIVGYEDQQKAATLLELGCIDYLLWPFSNHQLNQLLRRISHTEEAREDFVSCSQAGRRLLTMAQRVAMTRAPILVTGETGTGKEMIARYIHRFSSVKDAPFVAVNCAAIPESMLESILFGHEKGAFTGAIAAQPGKFEQANGGTLLLDEIGELPLPLQAKLLRVLQEQRVERLGGQREITLNVRIIAATNRDLQQEVAEGRFRSDLMFRLDVLPLHILPLRERKEDVVPLARQFIRKYASDENEQHLLTHEACLALMHHHWPGNIRELENTVQRALVLRNGLFIQPCDLGLAIPEGVTLAPQMAGSPLRIVESGKAALRATGKQAEHQHVIDTLLQCSGHKTRTAERLGMTPRALRYRLNAMREQGVDIPFE
ncbi:sigma-54-dependent transcriptional regulator [Pseudomonas profundi]|uniref:sigma-54-dependent transcriptional regulator n=1 Tax=Pseudomonas profundi TaxID=1981513 RepID=UPI0016801B85|nr:sigma-54 dependent transcriptional regulator [Pseudomonas profundi]